MIFHSFQLDEKGYMFTMDAVSPYPASLLEYHGKHERPATGEPTAETLNHIKRRILANQTSEYLGKHTQLGLIVRARRERNAGL